MKFKPEIAASAVNVALSQVQAREVKVSRLGARLIRLQGGASVEAAVARLKAHPAVAYAEPNYICKASQADTPNDPYYVEQWGLPAVQAPEAWKELAGASGRVTVAVVDTGVDYTHPDLQSRVDTANGKDYVNGDAAGDDEDGAMDDNGHGTHVAGIVAALTNNGRGVAGVAGEYSVTLLPIKVLDADGSGTVFDVAAGIEYAASQGADVINLSLAGPGYSQTLADAVAYAQNAGALVVAAAGNESDVVDYYYPAALPGVLAVGAVEQTDSGGFQRASFSNYGRALDVVAPGVGILSTVPDSVGGAVYEEETGAYYDFYSGTSMATPFVSGVAALLKLANPAATAPEIAARITGSALDLGGRGRDDEYGYGLVQAAAALGVTPEVPAVSFASPANGSQVLGRVELVVQVGQPDQVQAVGFYLDRGGAEEPLGIVERHDADQPQALYTLVWDTTGVPDGQYTLTARAKGSSGNDIGDPASTTVVVKNAVTTGLQFKVSNPDGSPAAGAVVMIWHRVSELPWPQESGNPGPATSTQELPPTGVGGTAPPPQPYWYEPRPAYIGFTDSQGQLRVPGSWTTDLNDYTAVILAAQEDAATKRLVPVLSVRQLEAPELVLVDGSRAVRVDFTARRFGETDGELLPLNGAQVWARVFDAQGVPLPFPLPLREGVLDEQGSMTAYLDQGKYDFHALGWEYGYYLYKKEVAVGADGQSVAVDFSLDDASRLTVDLQDAYSSAYLYLYDDLFGPAFGFPVTEGEEVVFTSGSYWPALELEQEQEGDTEGVIQKWTYYLESQEPRDFAPGEVALRAGGGLTASIDPQRTALYPGEDLRAASKFEDSYGFRLWGSWVEEEPVAQTAVAKRSGPLLAMHYRGQHPQRFQWNAHAYTWQQLQGSRIAGDVTVTQSSFRYLEPQLRILHDGEQIYQESAWEYYFSLSYPLSNEAAPGSYRAELSLEAGPLGSPLAVTDFTVLPPAASVTMQVYSPAGSPAADAWVSLLTWRGEPGDEESHGWWESVFGGSTGTDGTLTLPANLHLQEGRQYLLTVTGHVPMEQGSEPFFLYRSVDSLGDLQLVDGIGAQRVEVWATDKGGNPLDASVDATLIPPFGDASWAVSVGLGSTGTDGRLSAWLDPGTYHVTGARWPWEGETDAYYLLAPAQDVQTSGQEQGSVAATVYLRGDRTGRIWAEPSPAFGGLRLVPFTDLMDWTYSFSSGVPGWQLHLSPGTYQLMAGLGRPDQDGYWYYWEEAGWDYDSPQPGLTITPDTNRGIPFGPQFTAELELGENLLTPGEALRGIPVFADVYGNRVRDLSVYPAGGPGYGPDTRFALTPEGRVQVLDEGGRLTVENHWAIEPFLSIYRGDERIFHHKEWKNYWRVDWPVPPDAASGGYRAQVALQVGPEGVVSASREFQVVGGGPVVLQPRDGTRTNNPNITVSGRAEPNTSVQVYYALGDTGQPQGPSTVSASGNGDWQASLALNQGDGTYVIWAKNVHGTGVLESNRVHVVLDTTPPVAPDVQATVLDPKHVKLTWSNDPGEDIEAVEVYRQAGDSTAATPPQGSLVMTLPPVNRQYTDGTVQPQTTYTYWVAYADLAGNRAYGGPAGVTTPAEQKTINLRSVSFSVPRGRSGYAKIGGDLVVMALGDAGKLGRTDIRVKHTDGNEETISIDLTESPAGVYKGTYTIPAGVTAIESVQAALADPADPSLVSETKPAPGTPVNVGGSITGRVTKGGSGVAGAQVSVWSDTAGSGGWTTTSGEGSYTIAGLKPADDYTVSVSVGTENYWQQALDVGVAAGVITDGVDFQVPLSYTVRVRATDDQDGQVVPGIWISLSSTAASYSAWGYTSEDGVATFSRVPQGSDYILSTFGATSRGYLDRTWENVNILDAGELDEAGRVLALDFPLESLEKYTGKIAGTVTDAKTRSAVPSVSVSAWSNSARAGARTSTDETGRYELKDLPEASDYVLTFSHPDYFEETRSNVAVTAGSELPIDIPLNPGHTVTGVVYGQKEGRQTWEPLAGVSLYARDGAGGWFWTTSGADGRFAFTKLPEGTLTVSTSNRMGYVDQSQQNVQVDNTEPLVFVLTEAGSVDGYVRNESGAPISYVYINVRGDSGYGWARTGSDGYFKVRGLSAGKYSLTTSNYMGYVDQTLADITVEDGRTTGVGSIVLRTPEGAGKAFSGAGNGFVADSAAAAPGQVLTYKASYRNNSDTTATGVKLLLDIPENATLVGGSVVLNGNSVAGSVRNGKLEVLVGEVAGHAGGWVSYQVQVSQDLNRELSFLATGTVQWTAGGDAFESTLGAASTELVFTTIQGPTVTSSRSIKLFGKSLPGALIKVFDGDVFLGQTSASGRWWTMEVTLPDLPGDEERHSLTAQAVLATRVSNPSAPLEVLYQATIPRVEDVKVAAGWNGTVSVNAYMGLVTLGVTERTPVTVKAKFDSRVSSVYFSFLDSSYTMTDSDGDGYYEGNVPSGWSDFGEHPITLVFTDSDGHKYQLPIVWILVLIDPSGYVYEAVPDNRLPGVTARVEQKVGDTWVPWDAARYGQVNPQVTDEQGLFGWDVPAGEWRVVFSKEGYETLTSEVVTVPPPKTDLNVGLVSTATPEVTARTPGDGATDVDVASSITVAFSKYMKVSTFAAGTFTLVPLDDGGNPAGDPVSARISGVNAVNGLAKSIQLDPDSNLAYSSKYQVTVDATVEDYSGRHPAGDISWTFTTARAPDSGGGQPGGGGGEPGGGGGGTPGGGGGDEAGGGGSGTSGGGAGVQPSTGPALDRSAVEAALAADPQAPAMTWEAEVEAGKAVLSVAADALQLLQERGKGLVIKAGNLTVELPAGALDLASIQQVAGTSQNLAVRLEAIQEGALAAAGYLKAAPLGLSAVQAIDLQLKVVAAGQDKGSVTRFRVPVTVAVRLAPQDLQGKNVDLLGGYYLDEVTGKLSYVGGRYDAASGTFKFRTSHWSRYLIMEYRKEFGDLPAGHWAHNDVQVMAARHVVKGVSDTEFAPEANVTRAQFAALLVRALRLEPQPGAQGVFADVRPGQWFFAEVMAAYQAGLVKGYSRDKFAPDDPITREQMATMVVRALRLLEKAPALSGQEVQATLAGFSDSSLVSSWALEGMAVVVKAGIVRGRTATTLVPAALTTRAESAAMLNRLMQVGGLLEP